MIGFALAFTVGAALAVTGVAQGKRDAVLVDPDAHQVVMENDQVRVIEARASHGYKSPMHTHRSLVLVSIGTGRVKLALPDGKVQYVDLSPGKALWLDNPEHSWELVSGELHVIAVEVKAAPTKAAAAK
jgi:hypothetical protein